MRQQTRAGGLGMDQRRLLLNAMSYGLLILAIVIVSLPTLWMLTVSVRPNLEVMKIPPSWLPTNFTLASYGKILTSPRYVVVFLNTIFISRSSAVLIALVSSIQRFKLVSNSPSFASPPNDSLKPQKARTTVAPCSCKLWP